MMPFAALSALARAMFALWALLLCLMNIGSAVLAAVKKRLRFTAMALVLFAPVYFLWQIIFDLSLFGATPKATKIATVCGNVPWGYWLFAFAGLTAAAVWLLGYNIRYDRTFITPGTIKLYLDKMPCGICCWREDGRVLFSNLCMNKLCVALTGSPLLNGNQFCAALPGEPVSVHEKVWRFAHRTIEVDGVRLQELVASDITAEYAKTRALEKDKAELSRLNRELWEYYLSIDESVQRQEILQAKMNIHDEMNRLMLSSMAADKTDTQALDRIFSLWEKNALLLCLEADSKQQQQAAAVDSLAQALGVQLVWKEQLPVALGEKQKELFFFAAQEAIINALKHAQAKQVEISFEQSERELCCRFCNDGEMPSGEVHFEGGLANLAIRAKKQGAGISITVGERFSLELHFFKNR